MEVGVSSEQDRRFAVTHRWSEGDSNRRSHLSVCSLWVPNGQERRGGSHGVRLGLRRASSSVVRAALHIAAGQLLSGRGNRRRIYRSGSRSLFVSLQAETFRTGLWKRIEPVSWQEEKGT